MGPSTAVAPVNQGGDSILNDITANHIDTRSRTAAACHDAKPPQTGAFVPG
jgi:hypothetical protein